MIGTNYFRTGDICFATGNIYSYCSNVNSSNTAISYYNIFKNTIVRDSSKYKLNTTNDTYLITFVNNEDTSSLLPSGTDSSFLNSPIFSLKNGNTSSGGYLVAQVEDIITGDKIINYNTEYSPIQNTYDEYLLDSSDLEQAIKDFNDDYISATDTTNEILNRILMTLYSIDDKIDNISPYIDNSVSNVTNNVRNYFGLDRLAIKEKQQLLHDTWATHLGFLYDIPQTIIYALTYVQDFNNDTPITITIPRVEIFDHVLIHEYTYSFTDLFENYQTFNFYHEIVLVMSDTILMCLLIALGKKAYERVVEN